MGIRVRELAISAVVIVGAWASVGSGGSSSSSTDTTAQGSDTPTTAPSAAAHIGTAASDGKFTFTLRSVRCGISSVGNTYLMGATARGQFCEVKLRVENTGTESQDFMYSQQKAFSSAGNQVDNNGWVDVTSALGLGLGSRINPGTSIEDTLYYDIAKGRTISKFEFHDSPFSDGVTVLNQ